MERNIFQLSFIRKQVLPISLLNSIRTARLSAYKNHRRFPTQIASTVGFRDLRTFERLIQKAYKSDAVEVQEIRSVLLIWRICRKNHDICRLNHA